MLEKQRHQLLLDILEENQFASVKFLTEQLNSSEATIRRDIIKLANENRLRKIRGGAEVIESKSKKAGNTPLKGSAFLVNREQNTGAKRRIAQKAVQRVHHYQRRQFNLHDGRVSCRSSYEYPDKLLLSRRRVDGEQ